VIEQLAERFPVAMLRDAGKAFPELCQLVAGRFGVSHEAHCKLYDRSVGVNTMHGQSWITT
jgi:hypothetical protein